MRAACRLAAIWFLLLVFQAGLSAAYPKARGYVNDFAGILDGSAIVTLESELRATEQQTSGEIVLATVPSLDGMTVEEYANGLFTEWKIGKRGKDNGVLILVAPAERRVRIEVGYGLEPVLPDGLAGEIIRTEFLPAFRKGDFANGIVAGVGRVVEVVERDHPLTPDERRRLTAPAGAQPPWLVIVGFLGVFVGLGAFVLGLGIGGRTTFLAVWGAGFGGAGALMVFVVPSPDSARWTLEALGLGMFCWGFTTGRTHPLKAAIASSSTGSTGSTGSGESSSGWTSGTSSDSSGGSSDVDFGGGSSGGGGASGSW